jgi:hypothetical protein
MERPNYYLLLEIDPHVEDAAAIAVAIQNKKLSWSKQQNMGNQEAAGHAKANLARIPDITSVMADAARRGVEAQQAKVLLAKRAEDDRKDLADKIKALAAGGRCTSDRVDQLVKQYDSRIDRSEIISRIQKAGLTVEAPASKRTASGKKRPMLDTSRMDQMRGPLELVGCRDLYDFLKLSPNSSSRALLDCASERSSALFKKDNDAATNAGKALCGHAMVVFANEAEREKYNNSCAAEAMEALRQTIEIVAGADQYLSIKAQDEIVRQARERGVALDVARDFIDDLASKRRWGVEHADKLPVEELRQCGKCLTLTADRRDTRCGNCGEPLSVPCPRCGSVMPSVKAACSDCGFLIRDQFLVREEINKIDKLVGDRRLDAALAAIETLNGKFAGWNAIADKRDSIAKKVAQRNTERKRLQTLQSQRKLFECRVAIQCFLEMWSSEDARGLARQVSGEIERANREFEKAERSRAAGDADAAIAGYRNALAICADHPDAGRALDRLPPQPPTDLAVTPEGTGFRLQWKDNDKNADDYLVVRKAKSPPRSADDGTSPLATPATLGVDTDPGEGVGWYYAVFSRRGKVVSTRAAHSGPHLRTGGLREIKSTPSKQGVLIEWKPPSGCLRVEVWRGLRDAPSQIGIGVRVEGSPTQAHDTGLVTDTTYGYLMVPVFAHPVVPGEFVLGPASTLTATPIALPKPIADLSARVEDDIVHLRFTEPGRGIQAQIRRVRSRSEAPEGCVLSSEAANGVGTLVVSTGLGRAQIRAGDALEMHFVPFAVKSGTAVAGRAVSVVLVKCVTSLKADTDGRDIRLTWEWPAGVTRAAVCCGREAFPGSPSDTNIIRKDVTRAEYLRAGVFVVPKAEQSIHRISVFSLSDTDGIHSDAAQVTVTMGPKREFTYQIVWPRRFLGLRLGSVPQLLISGNGKLPETVLVVKRRLVPVSPTDGQELMHLPALAVEGVHSVPITNPIATESKAKLFFKNPSHVDEIRLSTKL